MENSTNSISTIHSTDSKMLISEEVEFPKDWGSQVKSHLLSRVFLFPSFAPLTRTESLLCGFKAIPAKLLDCKHQQHHIVWDTQQYTEAQFLSNSCSSG